ncbi:MAG: hypothetical protein JO307_10795 [Bryobacterales bacterium]|nr:hypothetical protein [Bryobacterales bacterium]MBV9401313.1 hypothetical protein [Bryobacterales bacterium]
MRIHIVAAIELALIFPAALFLAAVIAPNLISQPAPAAHGLVMWYAARMWTLWVLLLALPLTALVIGCATLKRLRPDPGTLYVAVATLAAAGMLAIVILHMLAN